jgi:GNAT superfamily N-acetyltransferase
MRIVEVGPADPAFEAVYTDILVPSFPPEERGTLTDLRTGAEDGNTVVLATLDDGDRPVAGAVGDWSAESGVALLSYLAVRPGQRGGGVGGELLAVATKNWRERWQPALMLAEIEHPGAHGASDGYGDPDKRVRFYARYGVRALAVPYFQPGLAPGSPRVYGVMLCAVDVAAAGAGPRPDTVDGARVAQFMTGYLNSCEGAVGSDPACVALFAALDQPGGVPLIDISEYARVPRSTPDGPVQPA